MKFKFYHNNYNVFDLEKSLKFYKEALGLVEVRRKVADDDSFILVFLGDETTGFQLELTWLKDRDRPYDLGEGEYHLAFIACPLYRIIWASRDCLRSFIINFRRTRTSSFSLWRCI